MGTRTMAVKQEVKGTGSAFCIAGRKAFKGSAGLLGSCMKMNMPMRLRPGLVRLLPSLESPVSLILLASCPFGSRGLAQPAGLHRWMLPARGSLLGSTGLSLITDVQKGGRVTA